LKNCLGWPHTWLASPFTYTKEPHLSPSRRNPVIGSIRIGKPRAFAGCAGLPGPSCEAA
jgi:hypothetical protein